MTSPQSNDWFEAAWAEREDDVYVSDFGSIGPGIYPLDTDVFKRLGANAVDPRWLMIGAFESPPNEQRNNWAYVTSGLSNAWEADSPTPDGWSGLGVEFLIQCKSQCAWALALVRNLAAYQLMLATGQFGERDTLGCWDRTGVGAPIDFDKSEMKALLFVPAPHFGGIRQIASGKFEYLQAVGLTAEEHAYGRKNGYDTLHSALVSAGASPVLSAERSSLV